MGSTAATFIVFAGTGVWRWQVRANFPKQVLGETHGPYSTFQSFTRRIEAPSATRHVNGAQRVVLAWDPSPMAKEYRVQLSHSDSFSKLVETHITENTSYAPKLIQQGYQEGGKLYWRVAAADEGHNLGAWTTRVLTTLKRMKVSAAGRLVKRRRGVVTIKVTDSRRRALRKARIKVSGSGVRARTKSTGKRGTVKFKLRAKHSGRVVFRALKNGYRPGSTTLRIR